jgi:hypothetical protein
MEAGRQQHGQAKTSLWKRGSHPALAWSGWLFGLLGLIATIYFYFRSVEKPEFTYYVSPTPTSLVAVGDATDIGITFRGQPLPAKNVSAIQVIVWNAGKRPIRHEDITRPYVVNLPVPIVSAKVLTTVNTDITDFAIDQSNVAKGILSLDWRLLEQGDHATIQIIYEGDVHTPVEITGSCVGQRGPLAANYDRSRLSNTLISLISALIIAITLLNLMINLIRRGLARVRQRRWFIKHQNWITSLVAGGVTLVIVATMGMMIYVGSLIITLVRPPFFAN